MSLTSHDTEDVGVLRSNNKIMPKDLCYKLINIETCEIIITDNILSVAKNRNLDSGRLYEVANGKQFCHRGWKCEYYSTP